jgi:hypothetical protein
VRREWTIFGRFSVFAMRAAASCTSARRVRIRALGLVERFQALAPVGPRARRYATGSGFRAERCALQNARASRARRWPFQRRPSLSPIIVIVVARRREFPCMCTTRIELEWKTEFVADVPVQGCILSAAAAIACNAVARAEDSNRRPVADASTGCVWAKEPIELASFGNGADGLDGSWMSKKGRPSPMSRATRKWVT